ncbi:hypothetical protein APV28_4114 [Comamonas testosteroni]|nr:hypothetical protein APV28_4114 [Comamonas testosteroni]
MLTFLLCGGNSSTAWPQECHPLKFKSCRLLSDNEFDVNQYPIHCP